MCGIAGFINVGRTEYAHDNTNLRLLSSSLYHRGPDSSGIFYNRGLGFAHTRLSIVDLTDNSSQPFVHSYNNSVLVFNGEIYNFKELRSILTSKGHVFTSRGDTEVLLAAFDEWGYDVVHYLRGMFAFAIWSESTQELYLARDPYGIKPLFFFKSGKSFYFSSEVRALENIFRSSLNVNPVALTGLLLFGSIPEPLTTYSEIRCIESGTYCIINQHLELISRRYFSLSNHYLEHSSYLSPLPSSGHLSNIFNENLSQSIRLHSHTDAPCCLLLSSGVDSSTLLSLLTECRNNPPDTITLGFSSFKDTYLDECDNASYIASLYGSTHYRHYIDTSEGSHLFDRFLSVQDQPCIDGFNTWLVTNYASKLGYKVAFSGCGADELLSGYDLYRSITRIFPFTHLFSSSFLLGKFSRMLGMLHPKASSIFTHSSTSFDLYLLYRSIFTPTSLFSYFDPAFLFEGLSGLSQLFADYSNVSHTNDTSFNHLGLLDSTFYLRNQLLRSSDNSSMLNSVELRLPFVDSSLLTSVSPFLQSLSSVHGNCSMKYLLYDSVKNSSFGSLNPKKKLGFSLPMNSFLEQSNICNAWQSSPSLAHSSTWSQKLVFSMVANLLPSALIR